MSEIQVFVKQRSDLGSLPAVETPLTELLERYVLLLGPDSPAIKGVVTQLLTEGKVYADFLSRSDRLELIDYSDCLTLSEAVKVLEEFLEARGQATSGPNRANLTQRIILRPPKDR